MAALQPMMFSHSLLADIRKKPKQNIGQLQQVIMRAKKQHRLLISCVATTQVSELTDDRSRPSLPVYQPSMWSHDFIQRLDDNFQMNSMDKVRELKKKVTSLNVNFENGSFNMLELLEHINDIERLGLGYRFQNYIQRLLSKVNSIYEVNATSKEESLYEASLRFRILRQHGYNVSQDFLKRFKDCHGAFIGRLHTDVKGLLSLYEASHMAFMEESDLHEAKLFVTEHLLKHRGQENEDVEQINYALELPLYHRMPRLQARCYINAYSKRQDANMILLELAILDFNMTQATFKAELKEVSRWWKHTGLAHKLNFVRDRIVECFFWAVGVIFEPRYHYCRVVLTKVCTLITVIDDIYDVYGSLDELEIFTDVVKRWDINAMECMPKYLQLVFEVFYNTITELGLIGRGDDNIPILVKVWGDLFEAFLVEAKWAHHKYIPTFEAYLENAWRSVSGVVILTHGLLLTNHEIKKDVVASLDKYQNLMKWSSIIFRLCNDLATSSIEIERGKNANAISCYMHENGVSEAVAREYIQALIDQAWRNLTKTYVACSQALVDPFIDMAINLARISCCTYQYGDDHGAPNARARERVFSVIIEPIKLREKGLILA